MHGAQCGFIVKRIRRTDIDDVNGRIRDQFILVFCRNGDSVGVAKRPGSLRMCRAQTVDGCFEGEGTVVVRKSGNGKGMCFSHCAETAQSDTEFFFHKQPPFRVRTHIQPILYRNLFLFARGKEEKEQFAQRNN